MNSLESNCAAAIVALLITDGTLSAIPPTVWNEAEKAPFPRLCVKATQGEDMFTDMGMYRMECEIEARYRNTSDSSDDTIDRVRTLITDAAADTRFGGTGAEIALTTWHFSCKGVEPGSIRLQNTNDERVQVLEFVAVGFDLDRFPTDTPIINIDTNGGLYNDESTVTLSCPDPDAQIYYFIGAVPQPVPSANNVGTLYSDPFTLGSLDFEDSGGNGPKTINVVAVAPGKGGSQANFNFTFTSG